MRQYCRRQGEQGGFNIRMDDYVAKPLKPANLQAALARVGVIAAAPPVMGASSLL